MDMFQESLGGHISVEQDRDDYIRPNADLEMRPQIQSKEQLKCMYWQCLDAIFEFQMSQEYKLHMRQYCLKS